MLLRRLKNIFPSMQIAGLDTVSKKEAIKPLKRLEEKKGSGEPINRPWK